MNNKPITIGILYTGGRSWIGGEHYILNLLHALKAFRQKQDPDLPFKTVLCYEDSSQAEHVKTIFEAADDFQHVKTVTPASRRRDQVISILNLYIPRRFRFLQVKPRHRFLAVEGIDVLYPFDFSTKLPQSTQAISWIPDFQPRLLPEFFPVENLKDRWAIEERIVEQADDIIFSSLDSIASYKHFFPAGRAKTHLFRFHTYLEDSVWEADPLTIQSKYHLPDKFFICCNQFWQHKRHAIVFESIAKLAASIPDLFVVFTGHTQDHRSIEYFDNLCSMINQLGIRANIAILGLIPKTDQRQLMRRSIGIIQPSLSEGWSTVVEDVRAMGKPSILSDLAVHLEQNPNQSVFFDRFSPDALQRSMADAWAHWQPGPDVAAEAHARAESCKRIEQMGEDFALIIEQVITGRQEQDAKQ